MVRHVLAFSTALTLMLSRDPSCGGTDSSVTGVEGPCLRDHDCKGGLACVSGVCTEPDGGAPPVDGGDAALTDAGNAG